MKNQALIWGASLALLGIAVGTFGAHIIRDSITEVRHWEAYLTGARYHMYHALALLIVGILASKQESKWLRISMWMFIIGIILFAGSLYALAISGIGKFGMITPLGGVSFMAGWAMLIVHFVKNSKPS